MESVEFEYDAALPKMIRGFWAVFIKSIMFDIWEFVAEIGF